MGKLDIEALILAGLRDLLPFPEGELAYLASRLAEKVKVAALEDRGRLEGKIRDKDFEIVGLHQALCKETADHKTALEDCDRLRKLLRRRQDWAGHHEDCGYLSNLNTPCTCGWYEFDAEVRAALEGRDG